MYIYCDQVPTWDCLWLQSTHVSDGVISATKPSCLCAASACWAWGSLQLEMLLGTRSSLGPALQNRVLAAVCKPEPLWTQGGQICASQEFLCFLGAWKWSCFYISFSSSMDVSASWFVLLWNWPSSWVCLMTQKETPDIIFLSEF